MSELEPEAFVIRQMPKFVSAHYYSHSYTLCIIYTLIYTLGRNRSVTGAARWLSG